MNEYSQKSFRQIQSCHPDLRLIVGALLKHLDVSVLAGHRGEKEQNEFFEAGMSQLKFPDSKHNSFPSMAVDIAPYPIDWQHEKRFYYMAGMVKVIAEDLFAKGLISHRVRWGGDWDMDNTFKDNSFNDLVHFELVEEE